MTSTHAIREDLIGRAIEQGPPRRTYLTRTSHAPFVPIPPVRLAPTAPLLAAARESELHRVVKAQIDWARPGREVGPHAYPADFENFLSITCGGGTHGPPESAEVAQGVRQFWDVLVQAGILHVDKARSLVWPGPDAVAITGPDPEAALHAWKRFVIAMLDAWSGVGRVGPDEEGLSTNLLLLLYVLGKPVHQDSVVPLLDDETQAGVHLHLNALAHAALLELHEAKVAITPLGRLVCHTLLQEATGLTIPVVGSFADADAATLLEALVCYRIDDLLEEVDGWLSGRSVETGIAEIRAALCEVGPMARHAGLDLLAGTFGGPFGTEGRRALLALAGDPRLGALAHGLLTPDEEERACAPHRDSSVWALLDLAAMSLDAGTPAPEMLRSLGYLDQPEEKMSGLIAGFGYVDHPCAVRFLDAVIAH
ncbi:hypothetical protein, partial [Actinomadura rubrisoli]